MGTELELFLDSQDVVDVHGDDTLENAKNLANKLYPGWVDIVEIDGGYMIFHSHIQADLFRNKYGVE